MYLYAGPSTKITYTLQAFKALIATYVAYESNLNPYADDAIWFDHSSSKLDIKFLYSSKSASY